MSHLDTLRGILGDAHVMTGADAAPYLTDWRERYSGHALAVVRPGSTEEVAAVVRACANAGVPLVPQGGNTGLCGGATPDASGRAVVVLLQRLNRIRSTDLANDTMEVEAGCMLQAVQQAAHDAGRLFPLSLAAEGSCTIGGNLATNAGGTQVLRYGTMRALVLGLEVVTAQGDIWHGLRGLRKDNTGYDLRDLYIGSEGTLGIITAATLKLYPQPAARCTALLALASIDDAIAMLTRARSGFGAALTGFELISGDCLAAVVRCFPQQRLPFEREAATLPWYALLEVSDSESETHARERFEAILGDAMESGRPITGGEADDAARKYITDRGFGKRFTHRTGHSIDSRDIHGSGPNIDNLETRDVRMLLPGVAFSIEPGIYIPGQVGVRSEVNGFVQDGSLLITPERIQQDLLIV